MLVPWALDALEGIHAAPKGKVRVEIVSNAGELSKLSTCRASWPGIKFSFLGQFAQHLGTILLGKMPVMAPRGSMR